MDYAGRSLKAQMKRADRLSAGHVLIVGASELQKGTAVLRDMQTKVQSDIELKSVVDILTKKFKTLDNHKVSGPDRGCPQVRKV